MNTLDGTIVSARTYASYTGFRIDNTMRRLLLSSVINGFAIITIALQSGPSSNYFDYIFRIPQSTIATNPDWAIETTYY